MDNPNPIRYSDLITPDDSITKLIAQLDELIAKYEAAKSKIQGAAAEAAKNMSNLSGATDEQRQSIAALTVESEKLAAAYKKSNDAESETYRRRQQVIDAVKEQQRVDKLLVQINNSKEGSYNRLSALYRLNKIRLNEMSAAERQTTEAGKALETETRKIYEEMSRLQKATGKYTLEVGHYENALRALPGPIGQVVSGVSNMRTQLGAIANSGLPMGARAMQSFTTVLSGTIGMVMLFVRYLTGAAKTMREFEQANANLSTILGVTRDDMKNLTNSALNLGRTTEYTASQVTQLQTELAKLGFGEGSILAMQKSVLQFATAVGANLADAAAVAGSTLRAFNLTSAETDDVLATLAVATNKSALSFDKIKQSIGTVFPVANAFGLSVKDTTALLGALANAGFDASSAATATRNIILKLADANGKLAKAMGGPAKTFDEIINGLVKLRDAGTDLNEALELTDRRSVAAFSAFMSGAESARELRGALDDVGGELDRIQRERLDTVEGSTKLLKSAWEGLTLAFSQSNGVIRDLIDGLSDLLTGITNLINPVSEATTRYNKIFTEQINTNYEYARINIEKTVKLYQEGGQKLAEYLGVSIRQANEDDFLQIFANNRALFLSAELKYAPIICDTKNAFGLLPQPKYDEDQDNYESSVGGNVLSFCIPSTNKELARTGLIVDYLTYESFRSMLLRYYDTHTGYKALTRDESRQCLEMIRYTKGLEVSVPYGWTRGLSDELCSLAREGRTDIASTILTYHEACVAAIDKTYEKYPVYGDNN